MKVAEEVKYGTLSSLASLLDTGADPNDPDQHGFLPLRLAVCRCDSQKLKLLIESGANVNATSIDGNTAIGEAVMRGRLDLIQLLLENGADISTQCDCGGLIALSVGSNHPDLVGMFAGLGLDINEFNTDGFTPLMMAAANGARLVIPTLLSCGALLELRDKNHGLTAYLHAALIGDEEIGRMLLDAGADSSAADNDGQTARMLAEGGGHRWRIDE